MAAPPPWTHRPHGAKIESRSVVDLPEDSEHVSPRSFPMTYHELVAVARRLESTTLETVTGRRFTVGVYLDCPFFTPDSTGLGRSDGRKAAERVVERFNQTGSLRPADYGDVTRNASYFIRLLEIASRS